MYHESGESDITISISDIESCIDYFTETMHFFMLFFEQVS